MMYMANGGISYLELVTYIKTIFYFLLLKKPTELDQMLKTNITIIRKNIQKIKTKIKMAKLSSFN